MYVRVAVSGGDLLVVYLGKPVVGGDSAGVRQNQTSDRVSNSGVFLDAPVSNMNIAVNKLLVVKNGGLHVADFLALLAVKNVCLGDVGIACLHQNGFYAVLNVLNADKPVFDLAFVIGGDFQGEKINDVRRKLLVLCLKCLCYCNADFRQIKIAYLAIALDYFIHSCDLHAENYLYLVMQSCYICACAAGGSTAGSRGKQLFPLSD